MSNPLMNSIDDSMNSIKRMADMYKASMNPQATLQQFANNNPQIKQIIQMSNGDLKGMFYQMCQEKGINPDDILNQFR